MTLRQFAQHLDKGAMMLMKEGDLDKAYAAMEVAAFIRRKPREVLRLRVDDLLGEN